MAEDPKKKADEAKKSLEDISEIVGALDDGFRSLTARLSDVVDELKDATSETKLFSLIQKDITRDINKIAKANETLLKNEIELGKNQLSSKKILSQIDELKSKEVLLSERIKYLEANKNDLMAEGIDVQQEINKLQEGLETSTKSVNVQLQRQYELAKAFEEKIKEADKELGVFAGVLKGIGKIPIIGDLVDTKDALQAARNATLETNSGLKGLKAGLGNLKGQVTQSLTNPANMALFAIVELGKAFLDLDKGIGEFAKGMNLSYQDAARLDQEFNNIANSSGDIAVTTKGIRETMLAMGQTMGSNAILNEKDAVTFTKLREQAGLANDELAAMEKLTLATGGNLEDNVSSMLYAAKTTALNNGVLLNEKQIMKEVAKASAATKLSLAGNPEALAKAAAQAKALGMSLEQVDKIASGLLDIESSISNELEAELLTGQNLNLEQARLYALNNDMEGLSKEIAKNFGSAAEFSKMNRIQQEAAAKAVGMTREELASTLTDQEALKGLSGKQAEDAKAALAAARARGMTEEEIKKQGIDSLMSQQSMQERFNNSVEKLKEIFVSLLEPLMPILDVFTSILKIVGLIFKPLGAIMSWAQSIGGPLKTVMGLLMGIGAAALLLNGSLTFGLGVAAVLAAVGAGMAIFEGIKSNAEKANDMVSPGYGKRTLMGPEGAIALNDKDTVIAGTNLFDKKGDDVISEPEKITGFKPEGAISATNSGTQIDYNALASAVVSALKNAPMTVNSTLMLDKDVLAKQTIQAVSNNATKVGTAAAVGTSKI